MECINTEGGVKNNIILEKNTGTNEFPFTFKSKTHILQLAEDKSCIFVFNKENPKEPEYIFQSLYIHDSFKETGGHEVAEATNFRHMSEDCHYELIDKGNGEYQIVVVISEEFLNSPEAVYPLSLDPTIFATANSSNAQDSYVDGSYPNSNYGSLNYLRFGLYNGQFIRAYFKFNTLPTIPRGAEITDATLKFTFRSGQTTGAAEGMCQGILFDSWSESTITFNNAPEGNGAFYASSNNFTYFEFPVLTLIKAWHAGNYAYHGFRFQYKPGPSYNDYNSVVSSEGEADRAPTLEIKYIVHGTTSGITSGQTYFIKNSYSGQYLEADPSLNSNVVQNSFHGNSSQQWKVVHTGNGLYKLYNQYTGYISDRCCLDLVSKSGSDVDVFSDSSSDRILFNLLLNGDGSIRIQNYWPKGTAVLTVQDTNALSDVYNSNWSGNSKQKWVFELANTKLSGYKTFSVFDVGNSTEDEATFVQNWMNSFGYKNVGVYDSREFTVPAQAIKDIGLYSDIIYINGHGDKYANLMVQNPSGTLVEYLCADETVNPGNSIPKVGIGAQWKPGSTTKTTSYWNKKTKWGILAQCDQLDYGTDGVGNHWNGLNSAQIWARTMLGDGVRVHGYLGYYNAAPPADIHLDRLNSFFEAAEPADNQPLVYAWKNAHDTITGKTNWAMLYHNENSLDRFSQFTANTTNGSAYTIYLVRRDYNSQLSLSSNAANAAGSLSTLSALENNTTPVLMSTDKSLQEANQKYTNMMNNIRLDNNSLSSINKDGKITYSNWKIDLGADDLEYSISDDKAVAIAKQKLAELGLLPEGDYRTSVSKTQRLALDLNGTKFSTPEIIEYSVCFYRIYNGIDVISDDEDGIVVTFNKNGISELKYLWRDVKMVESNEKISKSAITATQAYAIYDEASAALFSEKISNPFVSTAYLQSNGSVRPVWVFSTDPDYVNSVYVDMYTGEVICM